MNTIRDFLRSNNATNNFTNVIIPGYVSYTYNQPAIAISNPGLTLVDASGATNIIFRYNIRYNSISSSLSGQFVLSLVRNRFVINTYSFDLSSPFSIVFSDASPSSFYVPEISLSYVPSRILIAYINLVPNFNTGGIDFKLMGEDFTLYPNQWISRNINYNIQSGAFNVDYNDKYVFIENDFDDTNNPQANDSVLATPPETNPIKITSKHIYIPTDFNTSDQPLSNVLGYDINLVQLSFTTDKPVNEITSDSNYLLKPIKFISSDPDASGSVRISRDRMGGEYAINQGPNVSFVYGKSLSIYIILENQTSVRLSNMNNKITKDSTPDELIGALSNILNNMDVSSFSQQVISGGIVFNDFVQINSLHGLVSFLSEYNVSS